MSAALNAGYQFLFHLGRSLAYPLPELNSRKRHDWKQSQKHQRKEMRRRGSKR